MTSKLTYKELEQRVKEFEKESLDHKQVEEVLRKSEEKFRTIFISAPVGIAIARPEGRFIEVNDSVCRMLGYSKEELREMTFLDITYPNDRIETKKLADKVWDGKSDFYQAEKRYLKKDGSPLWATINASAVRDRSREIQYWIGIMEDITQRKQAEDALRKSEAALRSIFLAAPTGIGMVCDRVIKQANERLCEMLGYSQKELLENSARILYPTDEDFEYVGREKYSQIKEKGTGTVETRWQRKDGKIIDVVLSSTPIDPNDLSIGVTFTALDITERKQAEEALQESEGKYRTVLEANPDPVVVYDIEGKVIYFNPAFTRVFGWTLKERLGKKMDVFVPEEAWRETKMMIEKVLSGKRFSGIETDRYNKTGEIIPVSISGAIYKDQNNNPIGSVINLRDISDQKKLEAQLQQIQRMEAIGTLAGGIAHDFNNILSPIIGYSELAVMNVEKDSLLHEYLQEIFVAAHRARDLVKQILTFSRQTEHEQKPVQIKLIAKEVLKLLRSSLPTTVELQQNLQSDSLILSDPTQIHQILMNLCANAGHAMEENGGILKVDLTNVEIDSDFTVRHPGTAPGSYIKLTVSDTGHGILPHVRDRIFEPFFTTKEKGEGTGMGLSVVHGIIQSLGGTITIHSEPGKGSIFNVFLPSIEKRVGIETTMKSPIPTGSECILFIDDEEPLTKMGKRLLESIGYDVVTRTSSIEALELFKSVPERFDVVITDMTMPKLTGDKLAIQLLKIKPDIPIILCTGFSSMIDEEKAKAMGVRAFINKPIIKREIAETIRKVLDEK